MPSLYPFQRDGVDFISKHRRVLLSDQMGLGKSVQAIKSISTNGWYPALVVCPAHLKPMWRQEIQKWLPSSKIVTLDGYDARPLNIVEHHDFRTFVLINYAILAREDDHGNLYGWVDRLKDAGFRSIVADESHYAKSHESIRGRALKDIAWSIPNRVLLTGTPVLNRPIDLAHQLQILGRLGEMTPDEDKAFWPYARKFCDAKKTRWGWDVNGASNTDELHDRLTQTGTMLRRRKEDVLEDLPSKTNAVVPIDADTSGQYDVLDADWRDYLGSEDKDFVTAMGKVERLKQEAVACKYADARDWVEDFIASAPLIVFCVHQEVQKRLLEDFPDAAHILGVDDEATREEQKTRFMDGETDLLVGAMGTHAGASPAGIGHTLTRASDVAFLELGWTPGHHEQCVDRTHRISQTEPVTAWYLVAEDTIEDRLVRILDAKREVVSEVTDGRATSKEDVLAALMEQREVVA